MERFLGKPNGRSNVREFADETGRGWVAAVRENPGEDYKGRFYLVFFPAGEGSPQEFPVEEVRWNSLATAERTLKTMSLIELRRRLRSALGRVTTGV